MIEITYIDHLVLTVSSIEDSCRFYSEVLGMEIVEFGSGRKALKFGRQKINLHQKGKEYFPNARNADVGTADICLITENPLSEVRDHLRSLKVDIEIDTVVRTGALGKINSIYLRDPDGNLLEISNYHEPF